MNVDVRKQGNIVVVDFEGSLVVGVADEIVTGVVTELLADGFTSVLLNLSQIDYIDSSGLGDLVQSFKMTQRAGGNLKLLRPQERVRKTLRLSNLLPLFEVFDEEDEALRSFGQAEKAAG